METMTAILVTLAVLLVWAACWAVFWFVLDMLKLCWKLLIRFADYCERVK